MTLAINGYKECSGCKQSLEATSEFWHRNNRSKDGLACQCKDCLSKRAKRYREAHKEHRSEYAREYNRQNSRRVYLKHQYDITIEQYGSMFEAQGGVCAICHKPETTRDIRTGKIKYLAVDHDHVTGQIRGLLCRICNTVLGLMDDNSDRMRAAAEYLDRREAR